MYKIETQLSGSSSSYGNYQLMAKPGQRGRSTAGSWSSGHPTVTPNPCRTPRLLPSHYYGMLCSYSEEEKLCLLNRG